MTRLMQLSPSWVDELEREVAGLFAAWPVFGWHWAETAGDARWAPPCDVQHRNGDLVVRLDLPGVDPAKDVQVTVEDGMLCIRGERHEPTGPGELHRPGWRYGPFEQGITLPEGISTEGITASYADGVLEIVVPEAAALAQPRRIPVTASTAKTLPQGKAAA
jgi:HSP20 family protein